MTTVGQNAQCNPSTSDAGPGCSAVTPTATELLMVDMERLFFSVLDSALMDKDHSRMFGL